MNGGRRSKGDDELARKIAVNRRDVTGGGLFILPSPLFEVFTGRADGAAYVLFAVGALLLVEGLALVTLGLRNRSGNLRTARTYDNREGSTSDEDRPVNPHDYPSAGRQGQLGGPL